MKKKYLVLCLVLVCSIFVLTGCGQQTSAMKKETLIMGTNAEFPPFEYREGNDVKGFDVDLVNLIAEKIGRKVEVMDMGFDGLIPALGATQIDFIASGMTVTPERAQSVSFTDGYYKASQVIIVKKGSEVVKSKEDLVGKKIGVQLGTTGDLEASKIEKATVVQFDKGFSAIMELQKGGIDAVVLDSEPANQFVKRSNDLEMLGEQLTEEEYAFAARKGDQELVDAFNKALKEIIESGAYNELLEKHMGK